MTPEQVLLWVAGVQLPKADSDGARTMAGYYRDIADAVDRSGTAMEKVVGQVKSHNDGDGPAAFERYWGGSAATGAVAPSAYPADVSAYARRVADSLEQFAKVNDEIRAALWVLAIQLYANIVFTICYGWLTGVLEARLLTLIGQARWYGRIRNSLVQLLVKRVIYALADSVAYAGGQQALQLGIYGTSLAAGVDRDTLTKVAGYDPLSVRANAVQLADGFVGNMAYDGVADALPGLNPTSRYRQVFGRYFLRRPGVAGALGGLTTRMAASNAYTYASNVTDSYLEGDGDGWTKPPTLRQEAAKLFIHVPRIYVKYPLRWKNWPNVSGQTAGPGTP
ncbi:hypothetical protein [Actinoallomurus iriomotensis]|uniref:Uncharacterized protein n=1 Tax=Actinoallomurus iriomotensis TaxID=478107 RepID=A0A9W6S6F3_9ACTN|nr:hypothetical protein [Actinoallomurus iriomotensis]GLY87944.1 hypothetical protein Airi02_058730 [Actinoallomurus iriomotensis]